MTDLENLTQKQLMAVMIAEQRRTNELLAMMIEDECDEDGEETEPVNYMDGTPRG